VFVKSAVKPSLQIRPCHAHLPFMSCEASSITVANLSLHAFSSPEPLGLICNEPVEPLVSRPRDQETAGSRDENVVANGI